MTGRLGLPGLRTPHPLAATLPAVFEDDDLARFFAGAFDGMLAPVQSTLDCLTAYVDAGQAPADFLALVGALLAAPLDRWMPVARRRRLVAATGELQRRRGTRAGLVRLLEIALGATDVAVEGGGGTWWAAEPDAVVPEQMAPLVVRMTLPAHENAEPARLDRLVATMVPAHLPFRVEVTVDGALP